MENTMMMPAKYDAVPEEEMVYTCGGELIVPLAIAGALSVGNLVWGVSHTRTWLQANKKTEGDEVQNAAELLINGIDSAIAYAGNSIWKAIVSVYTAANLALWWPVTAIAWLTV